MKQLVPFTAHAYPSHPPNSRLDPAQKLLSDKGD